MPRPLKPGLIYFSLDTNFFSDRKIKSLRSRFGSDGPQFYLYILCEIYRDQGYYLITDSEFQGVAADDLGVTPEKIGLMLNFLLNVSLLDSKLFSTDKILTSHGIQIRYQEMVKNRAKKTPVSVVSKYWILNANETQSFIKVRHDEDFSEKNSGFSGNNGGNFEKNPPKVKKSKVKENKEAAATPAEDDPQTDKLLSRLSEYLQSMGGFTNFVILDELKFYWSQGMDEEVIKEAMNEAARAQAVRWPFIKAVLESWRKAGAKNLAQAKAQMEAHKRGKSGLENKDRASGAEKYGTYL